MTVPGPRRPWAAQSLQAAPPGSRRAGGEHRPRGHAGEPACVSCRVETTSLRYHTLHGRTLVPSCTRAACGTRRESRGTPGEPACVSCRVETTSLRYHRYTVARWYPHVRGALWDAARVPGHTRRAGMR